MWPYPWTHVETPSHLGHMDRVAATMPSQAHAGAAQEAPDIGQWEGQDVPLVRPSSCNVKGGIPSSRRYLPTYLPTWHLSHSHFTLPPPGALVSRLVARMLHRTLLRPSSLYAQPASPSLPCPVTPLPLAGHCVGKSHACRKHAPGPRCMTLRRTLHPWGWTALRQRAAALRLVQCPRARRAARSVVGHLCASAPRSLLHAAVARPLPCPAFSAPLPSGQREHNAEQFAWQRSLFAPSLCPGPLALSCLLSARPPSSSRAPLPRSLGPWPSVSLSQSSLYPPGIHFAEQHARHPSHSAFTLPLPGALVPSAPARSLRPSTPALPPPPPPALFPLYTYIYTLRRTLCRQVARLSQARTRPLPPCPALSPLFTTQNTSQDTV